VAHKLSLQFGPDFADPLWADRGHSLKPPTGPDGSPVATEWLLGRHSAAHVRLDVSDISNRHAVIAYHPVSNAWSITDVNSKNGTFLRKRRLPVGDPFPIVPGDSFWLGKNRIIVSEDEFDTFPNNNGDNPHDLTLQEEPQPVIPLPGVRTPPDVLPPPPSPQSDVQAVLGWVKTMPSWLQVLLLFLATFVATLWVVWR
jgi:hypothetical protein